MTAGRVLERIGSALGLVAVLAATVVACSAVGEAPAAPPPGPAAHILVPERGALLGHYYGSGTIAETDARIGRKPAVHLAYYGWADDWVAAGATRADLAGGRIPLINWGPFGVSFDDLAAGELDDTVEARADGVKTLGAKVIVDFAAEMNEEEGWGGHSPAKYIAAYRHIHDVFAARGVTNVVWAWCPNNTDTPGAPPATAYYPGDEYVDWTGVDGYNWGTSEAGFGWQSFEEVFADSYGKLAALRKPIIIGEMASDETGGDKARWVGDVVPALQRRFPLVKAVVWFDVEKERRWQITSSVPSLAAYQRMAKDPYFNP
ncbi:glycosyl hydrolase [Amycolatopsis sp. A133]|uniref:glycoside hydrolase family 26 protein n=1 Tax=Amycolatopsis sp. A133 TaxID=3064472 RepID=UPI0027E9C359|nr:glycosyl hydrolase [Amycolatopsis sp. A133]MDQ7810861.1 glycosyl hydrolase [Amycolatopsis sp. A133]